MGAWGAICVFDHAAFVTEVIPALRAGESHPLVAAELARGRGRRGFDLGELRGLADVVAGLDEDFTASTWGRQFRVRDGVVRTEPDWAQSLWQASTWGHGELCELFERLVTRHCISHFASIGRVYRLASSIAADAPGLDDLTRSLVARLDRRGDGYWSHNSGGYGEGITGWLDIDEAWLLADGLPGVSIDPDSTRPEDDEGRLRTIRLVADEARRRGKGLLWGIDLAIVYDLWEQYDGGAHRPLELA